MSKKRMIHAINDALFEEMQRDPKTILFGEDVKISLFGDTKGLMEKFGNNRVRNTPISETVMTGMAVGAAAAGWRVICHMMFGNFLYTGFDSIANQASKLRYMTAGQISLPIVYMAVFGGGRSSAAQHSDAMHPILMNLGGIKVVTPGSPADAKGLLKSSIRDNNPVVFLQAAGRGGESGEVPDGEHIIELGKALKIREGDDITLVPIGSMVRPTKIAAEKLAEENINAEIIDPRTLVPLDKDLIFKSLKKTGRLIIIDEARDTCSAASHISALCSETCFGFLKSPVMRVTVPDIAIPYSPPLEKAVIPSPEKIIDAVKNLFKRK